MRDPDELQYDWDFAAMIIRDHIAAVEEGIIAPDLEELQRSTRLSKKLLHAMRGYGFGEGLMAIDSLIQELVGDFKDKADPDVLECMEGRLAFEIDDENCEEG